MAKAVVEETVKIKRRVQPRPANGKSRSIDWYSEHDTAQDVFEYVRDDYNMVVGVRVDGGIYR